MAPAYQSIDVPAETPAAPAPVNRTRQLVCAVAFVAALALAALSAATHHTAAATPEAALAGHAVRARAGNGGGMVDWDDDDGTATTINTMPAPLAPAAKALARGVKIDKDDDDGDATTINAQPAPKNLKKADGIFGSFSDDDDSTTLTDDRAASTTGAKGTDSLANVSGTVPPPNAKKLKKADGIFGSFNDDDDSTTLTDDRATSTTGAYGGNSLPNVSSSVPPPSAAKNLKKADGIFGSFSDDDDSTTLTDDRASSTTGAKGTDSLANVSGTVPPPNAKKLKKADGIFGSFSDDDDSTTLTDDRASSTTGAKGTDSLANVSGTVPPPQA